MNTYAPTWAEINLDNILHNYNSAKALTEKGTKVCAIIKANAYSHGSIEVAKHLEKNGCDYFGVATFDEAMELRNNGIKMPIMCLSYIEPDKYEGAILNDIDIPLFSYETAQKVSETAQKLNTNAKIQVKLDTGMSRVGFLCNEKSIDDIEKISKLENVILQGIYTHFALADTRSRTITYMQYDRYSKVVQELKDRGVHFKIHHVCNSAGIISYPEYHLDMVRLGISLYGHYPSEEIDDTKIELRPAMTLKTKISNIKLLPKGEGVSYGHTYHPSEDEEYIATLPIGYGDGYTRMMSGKAEVFIKNQLYTVVGRICMDQCMVKVSSNIKVGDEVILMGKEKGVEAETIAKKIGTINYEILCMVQRRIPRVYFVNGKVVNIVNYLLD